MMKKIILLCAFAALFLFTGCSSPKLNIGVYRNVDSSRDDMAMVCDEYIVLQVKSPENAEGALAYWTWGGTYSLDDDGTITLDMDKETRKRWMFYFNFLGRRDGIVINDLANETGIILRYELPKRRKNEMAPVPVGSTGINPKYQYPDNQ